MTPDERNRLEAVEAWQRSRNTPLLVIVALDLLLIAMAGILARIVYVNPHLIEL